MNKLVVIVAACAVCQASFGAPVSEEVFDRISCGIREIDGLVDLPAREAVQRRALDGLSDKEIIRGISEWMFRHPRKDHSMLPSLAKQILISPERKFEDVSELRNLMNAETDSNRFFMLSSFSTLFESRYAESFMVERARGLTMSGPAARHGQGQTEYRLSDISLYTYDTILSDLRGMNSPFVKDILPTLEGSSDGTKVIELARWLKANWPGCEHLEVPEAESQGVTRHASTPGPRHPVARSAAERPEVGLEAASDRGKLPGIRLLGLLGLALLVLLVWKTTRRIARGGGS